VVLFLPCVSDSWLFTCTSLPQFCRQLETLPNN
jgi:hypothetical protein